MQTPETDKFFDLLAFHIRCGDIGGVRDCLDKNFWNNNQTKPGWFHLRLALHREDRPMMKLLVQWGAEASAADLWHLRQSSPDQFDRHLLLLRNAGMSIPALVDAPDPARFPFYDGHVKDTPIPAEWLHMLQTARQHLSPHALIGGGWLGDLFNGKPISDIDIFLPSQGNRKANRAAIEKLFDKAGVRIAEQIRATDIYNVERVRIPLPRERKLSTTFFDRSSQTTLQNWKIVAEGSKTVFNIIFVTGQMEKDLKQDPSRFIAGFDVGLCQIGCDGERVFSTGHYRHDVENRILTLRRLHMISVEHLSRLSKKYDDWDLCTACKTLLLPKPPEVPLLPLPPRYRGWY